MGNNDSGVETVFVTGFATLFMITILATVSDIKSKRAEKAQQNTQITSQENAPIDLTFKLSKNEDEILTLLLHLEDYRLRKYKDIIGVETVGIGFTKPWLKKHGYEMQEFITLGESIYLILLDYYTIKDLYFKSIDLTDAEYNTLYSFIFNVGTGNFENSTLYKRLRAGEAVSQVILEELPKFIYAGGNKIKGLERRRQQEINYLIYGLDGVR